jgi:hypothetical protein
MKNIIRIPLLFITVQLFAMTLFGQGLYWESKTVLSMMPDKEILSKTYYLPGKLKQSGTREGVDVIIRLDRQVIVTVDSSDKTYSEMTFAELEGTMQEMGSKLSEMEKELEKLPPEQRKMVEQMMAGKMGAKKSEAKVEVAKTGEKKTIAGYSCSEFVAKQDGKTFLTVWTTNDIKGPEGLGKEMKEFGRRISEMSPMFGKGRAEAMKSIEGFPLQTESEQVKTVVTKVEKRSINGSEFEVPEGYTKVKPKAMGRGKGG